MLEHRWKVVIVATRLKVRVMLPKKKKKSMFNTGILHSMDFRFRETAPHTHKIIRKYFPQLKGKKFIFSFFATQTAEK